jgi:murein DD-endopeptidase MepM/ murein hydrolase activator NlpD
MIRRMNVLIVPDEGGQSKRLNIPLFLIQTAAWILFVLAVGIIAAIVNYSRFAHKALDWDRLAAENERLAVENRRILKAANEVEQGRLALAEIIHTMHETKGALSDTLLNVGRKGSAGGISDEALAVLKGRTHSAEQFIAYGYPTQWPVRGFISQRFYIDRLFSERSHRGIDIAGRNGTPVLAAASGKVIFEGWTPIYGNCMILSHRAGYTTMYGHNELNLKKIDEEVKRGEPIASLGSTGNSTAPHVHFEIWKDGAAVDPMKLLQTK